MEDRNIPIEEIEFTGRVPGTTRYMTTRTTTESIPLLQFTSSTTTPCIFGDSTEVTTAPTSSTTSTTTLPAGTLCVSPTSLEQTIPVSGCGRPFQFDLYISRCEAGGSVPFSITANAGANAIIQSITPSSGIAENQNSTHVTITLTDTFLDARTYTGELYVAGGTDDLITIPMSLTVTGPMPRLNVTYDGSTGTEIDVYLQYAYNTSDPVGFSYEVGLYDDGTPLTPFISASNLPFLEPDPQEGIVSYEAGVLVPQIVHVSMESTALPVSYDPYTAIIDIMPTCCPHCPSSSGARLNMSILVTSAITTTSTTTLPSPIYVLGTQFDDGCGSYNGVYVSYNDGHSYQKGSISLSICPYQGRNRWLLEYGCQELWGPEWTGSYGTCSGVDGGYYEAPPYGHRGEISYTSGP